MVLAAKESGGARHDESTGRIVNALPALLGGGLLGLVKELERRYVLPESRTTWTEDGFPDSIKDPLHWLLVGLIVRAVWCVPGKQLGNVADAFDEGIRLSLELQPAPTRTRPTPPENDNGAGHAGP